MHSWQKQRAQERRQAYAQQRDAFLREHRYCQAQWACAESPYPARATQVHHARGRTGRDLLDPTTWWAVCHACHERIHQQPKEAYRRNLMESRLTPREPD